MSYVCLVLWGFVFGFFGLSLKGKSCQCVKLIKLSLVNVHQILATSTHKYKCKACSSNTLYWCRKLGCFSWFSPKTFTLLDIELNLRPWLNYTKTLLTKDLREICSSTKYCPNEGQLLWGLPLLKYVNHVNRKTCCSPWSDGMVFTLRCMTRSLLDSSIEM